MFLGVVVNVDRMNCVKEELGCPSEVFVEQRSNFVAFGIVSRIYQMAVEPLFATCRQIAFVLLDEGIDVYLI